MCQARMGGVRLVLPALHWERGLMIVCDFAVKVELIANNREFKSLVQKLFECDNYG